MDAWKDETLAGQTRTPPCLLTCRHIFREPVESSYQHIRSMLLIYESVTLVGVNNQLGGYMLILERMPELKGLRCRALAVAVADHYQNGGLDLSNEIDR